MKICLFVNQNSAYMDFLGHHCRLGCLENIILNSYSNENCGFFNDPERVFRMLYDVQYVCCVCNTICAM